MELLHIDLDTLLRALARRSGTLVAQVKNISGTRGRAQVVFDRGKVLSCVIEAQGGGYLAVGEKALRLLQDMGELDWAYVASHPAPAQPEASPRPAPTQSGVSSSTMSESRQIVRTIAIQMTDYPIRLRNVEMYELITWSRLHRSVYSMIDGKKNVAAITNILSYPQDKVLEALTGLREAGVITVSSQASTRGQSTRRLPPNFE